MIQSREVLELPGGLLVDDRVERQALMRPITGSLELAITECMQGTPITPQIISHTLSLTLDSIGGKAVDCEVSGQLCVADRQFLMLQLGSRVAEDQVWLQPECNNCQQPFDLGMQRSAIPVQPAGPGYPYTQVLLGNRLFKLRVPTGKDQEMIATLDGEDALRILVKRCIVSVDGMAPNEDLVAHLSLKDISKLEAAIEAVSPMTATRINTRCPECGHPQAIALDLYEIAGGERTALYEDVHRLAFQYHWNEAEILALPRERRKLYLALLDRARGVYN